eukprot:3293444-Heterocapsa_arctica.AAC.1
MERVRIVPAMAGSESTLGRGGGVTVGRLWWRSVPPVAVPWWSCGSDSLQVVYDGSYPLSYPRPFTVHPSSRVCAVTASNGSYSLLVCGVRQTVRTELSRVTVSNGSYPLLDVSGRRGLANRQCR